MRVKFVAAAVCALLCVAVVLAADPKDAEKKSKVMDDKDGPVDGYDKHTVVMTHGDSAMPYWDAIVDFKTPQFSTRVHRLRNTLHITWEGYVARLRCGQIKEFLDNAFKFATEEGTQIVNDFHDITRLRDTTVQQCFMNFVDSCEGSSNVNAVFIIDKDNQRTRAATEALEKAVAGKIHTRVISDAP